MALDVRASFTTSKNLFTRLVRQSDSLHWDDVGTVWGAVNDANNRIAMTEGPFDGRYAATVTGLGEDQWVEVYVEESTDPDPAIGPVETIGVEQVYIVAGNEAPIPAPGAAVRSTKIVADERTWRLQSNSTGHIATNVIKLVPAGAATSTVAMDFSEMLNPETALLSVSSAVEVTAFSLGLGTPEVSDDLQSVHVAVSSVGAGKTHQVKITVATTDSNTISGIGYLQGQA